MDFTDANNDAHVTPGWAATNTVVNFSSLYRRRPAHRPARPGDVAGRLHEHQRQPTAFSSGTWSAPAINQTNRTIDASSPVARASRRTTSDWARIDVKVDDSDGEPERERGRVADADLYGYRGPEWGAERQSAVLIGVITNPSATITLSMGRYPISNRFCRTTSRQQFMSGLRNPGSGVKYTDLAVPTCFSSPAGVTLSNPGAIPTPRRL